MFYMETGLAITILYFIESTPMCDEELDNSWISDGLIQVEWKRGSVETLGVMEGNLWESIQDQNDSKECWLIVMENVGGKVLVKRFYGNFLVEQIGCKILVKMLVENFWWKDLENCWWNK